MWAGFAIGTPCSGKGTIDFRFAIYVLEMMSKIERRRKKKKNNLTRQLAHRLEVQHLELRICLVCRRLTL